MPRIDRIYVWPVWPKTIDPDLLRSLEQLNTQLQLALLLIAQRINDELAPFIANEKASFQNQVGFTSSGTFQFPQYTGDPASPLSSQVWENSTLHRFRGNTDSGYVQSFGFLRALQFNFALGSGVTSVSQTLTPAEPDTSYIVKVETTWLTTWSISSKAVGSFTINFGTATPDALQKVSYALLR